MPFTSGTYSLPSGNPVVTGTTISSSTTNTTNSDIATALSSCILKDGTQTVTADIPMASHKITGLAAPTTAGDALSYGSALGTPASGVVTNLTGTASININGTVGATTATTGAFTTLAYTGTLTGSTGILNIGSGQVYKDASGNVGIGTSSLSNGVRTVIQGTQTGGAPQTSGTAQTYGLLRLQGTSFTSVLDFGTNGGNYNWIQATDSANLATNYSLALNPNGGNVGIGTSSPSKKLSINGDFRLGDGGGTGAIFTDATVGLRFMLPAAGTSTTESMRIDSSGNLLVGTTASSARLFAVASTGIAGKFLTGYASDVASASLLVSKTDNVSTTSQIFARFSIAADTIASGQINANGASACAFGSWSDSRLKVNIIDLPSQLDNILALRPVEFDFIESEGGGHQIGFIAQEVQEIYPDLVGTREDGMFTLSDMNKNDARLIKAIQEQQTLIEALTARLTALEAK